jgi:hypothetical protein
MNKSYFNSMKNISLSLKPSKAICLLLMVLFVCLFSNVTSAQKTWDGGAGTSNWGDGNNWSPNGAPTITDAVTLTNNNAVIVNIPNALCASLQLGGTAGNTKGIINFSTSGSPSLTVVGAVTMGGSNVNPNRSGTITFVSGSTLICGSLTLGNSSNSPSTLTMSANSTLQTGSLSIGGTGTTWTPSTGTVIMTANNIIPNTIFTSFSNLTISAGTTTFGATKTITNNFSIAAGAIANLGTFTHTASTLTLAGVTQVPESWGSTSSVADNKNDTYFATTVGLVSNSCSPPPITSQPTALAVCENSGGVFAVATSASSPTYQWQYSTDGGLNWVITNGIAEFSGHTSATLILTNIPASYNGYRLRCIVRSSTSCRTNSNSALLTVNATPISGTVTPATCSNGSDGAITITGLNVPVEFKKADNDYIDLGGKLLSNRSAFTVEGWIKFNIADVGARMSLFGQNDVIEFFLNTNTMQLYTAGGGGISTPLTAAFGNNTWHHIAATGDGTNLKIYIDGISVATGGSVTANYGPSTAYNAQIGSGVVDPLTTVGGGFTGQIEKVGFYSSALSAAAITSLATSPTTYLGTEAGIIAGYNFFEGAGTTLTKLPTGTNGTFGNSPQWVYTYAWTKTGTPSFTAATENISGLSPGDYNLTITALGGGCPITKTFTVGATNTAPSSPIIGTITQPTCSLATGSVVLSGLPATWTLTRSGNSIATTSGTGTTTTISGLAIGTYAYTVYNGTCTSAVSGNVVIAPLVTNTWNGTTWSTGSPPTSDENIVFANVAIVNSNLVACSCQANADVTVNSGYTITLTNSLTVAGGSNMVFKNGSSLVQINNVVNTGIIEYDRNTQSRNTDYTYWSSPVSPQTLYNLSPLSLAGTSYSYEPTASSEDWSPVSSSTTMVAGKGYIVRGPEASGTQTPPTTAFNVAFSGVPNNGTYPVSVFQDKSCLLGNPYPSAIDTNTFLNENTGVLYGTLYFWTHNTQIGIGVSNPGTGVYAYSSDDYAIYNATGGTAATQPDKDALGNSYPSSVPTGNIAAGQGFFATAKATGTVMFNNTIRIASNNSQFYKNRNSKTDKVIEKNRIWLNLTNTQGAFKQTLIGYITDATNSYDDRFDGESFDGNEFVDFYSVNQDKNLVIQGRALPFDENDEVPLGYRTTINGAFTINIDQTDGLLTNQTVFIEDKLTNIVTDLKSGNYTFNTVSGTFNDRFVLRYTNKTLEITTFDSLENTVLVSNKNKQIKINSFAETIDKVVIYDLLGRQIYQKDKVNSNELSIANLASSRQTLIIKTVLQNGQEVSKKIVY